MEFAILGHLIDDNHIKIIPKKWIHNDLIVSHRYNFEKTGGYILGLMLTAKQMVESPKKIVRNKILDTLSFAQNNLDIELIQLGALTTSITSGGRWIVEKGNFKGHINHGDSYTAAIACQVINKVLNKSEWESSNLILAIVGAYGIIGEAISKIMVPKFFHSILIGRRKEKLESLSKKIKGNHQISTDLKTNEADIIVTATSHPAALLKSDHLKKNAIIIDISQPPNLSEELCLKRTDICRIDGGYVDCPTKYDFTIPGVPKGKCFSCMAEVIMQAMEKQYKTHVGSIDLNHLHKTERWGEKHGFTLKELTNFGETKGVGRKISGLK